MLTEAKSAVQTIKMWWNTDFAPKKSKYPIPDSEAGTPRGGDMGQAASPAPAPAARTEQRASERNERATQKNVRASERSEHAVQMQPKKRDTKIYANEIREAYEAPIETVGPNDVLTVLETKRYYYRVRSSSGIEGYVQKNELTKVNAKSAGSKSMAFEAAEVMGYLDNPTPVYIVDIDDPNADPITLGGGFSGGRHRSSGGLSSRSGSSSSASSSAPSPGKAYENASADGGSTSSAAGTAKRREETPPAPTITVKSIRKDNDYLKNLTGNAAEDYKIYLKLRNDYTASPTFYFDMADWFYTHNDKKIALRVLTSIADLDLENALLYRLLGYRLKEYGEYAIEAFVCRKVVQWRPMEPQSFRDYALALADNGNPQTALDSLNSLLTKPFSDNANWRGRGIEEIVVTEINHLIAKNANLNTSKIDTSVITNIPVDIRVVINWNMNNTDIDLHVVDPNNEECYYSHRATRIGGRISGDVTSGYGPEQFILKSAVKGKYRVFVNYYSDTQVTLAGPSTVMVEIFTKYADKTEQRRVVCLQMSSVKKKGGNVEVAEFEF